MAQLLLSAVVVRGRTPLNGAIPDTRRTQKSNAASTCPDWGKFSSARAWRYLTTKAHARCRTRPAEWLFDLLGKLGLEDDAYHATCLLLMEYSNEVATPYTGEEAPAAVVPEPGPEAGEEVAPAVELDADDVDRAISTLPKVKILEEKIPNELAASRFLAAMVTRVLRATPVSMHKEARSRRALGELRR